MSPKWDCGSKRVVTGGPNKQDQILLVKIAKYIGFVCTVGPVYFPIIREETTRHTFFWGPIMSSDSYYSGPKYKNRLVFMFDARSHKSEGRDLGLAASETSSIQALSLQCLVTV